VRISPRPLSPFAGGDRRSKYGAVDQEVVRPAEFGYGAADSPLRRREVIAHGPRDPLQLKVFQDHEAALAIGGEEGHTVAGRLKNPGLVDQRRALANAWLLGPGSACGRGADGGVHRPTRRWRGVLLGLERVRPSEACDQRK
jgi:hypothetical protein